MVGVGGERTIAGVDRRAAVIVGRDHRSALALGETEPVGQRGAEFLTVYLVGLGVTTGELGAAEIPLHDVVHDTRDGVGAVDR